MADPTPLRKPEPETPVEKTPGLDIGYTRSLGPQAEHGQMSFRTMFAADTPFAVQGQIVSNLVRLGELTEMRAKLRAHRKELALTEARLSEPDDDQRMRREQIKVEISALEAHQSQVRGNLEREFRASGHQGRFKPEGAGRRELEQIGIDIGKLVQQEKEIGTALDRRVPELEKARDNWKVAIANLERDIGVLMREAEG